jgi:hypothetical protein
MREELRKQNVTCYFEGTKKVGGVDTGEPCIVVGVVQKLPLNQLPPDHIIPSSLDGLVTDVIQTGQFKALLDNKDEHRPMVGGISLGMKDDEYYGTLGVIVRDSTDGTLLGLTNNHVVGQFYDPTFGVITTRGHVYPTELADIDIVQPSEGDGGVGTAYAKIKRIVPLQVSGGTNIVDAAVFEMGIDDAAMAIYSLHAGPFLFADRTDFALATPVYKSGRTTSLTPNIPGDATVTSKTASVLVDYSGTSIWQTDQIVITGTGFAAAGDSGSAVVAVIDGQWKIIGLLFASAGTLTVANHIDNVATALDIESWDGSLVIAHNEVASFTTITGVVYDLDEPYTDDPITHTILFGTPYIFETVLDGFFLQCDPGTGWGKGVSDTLDIDDAATKVLAVLADEWLIMVDTYASQWRGQEVIADYYMVYDDPVGVRWALRIAEDAFAIGIVTDIPQYQLGVPVDEWLFWGATITANWRGVKEVRSSLYIYDDVVGTKWIVRIAEDAFEIGNATDEVKIDLAIALLEYLGFESVIHITTTVNVSELLGSQDEARAAYHFIPEDTLDIVDSEPVKNMICNVTLPDVIVVFDEILEKAVKNGLILDTITLAETISSNAHLYSIVQDAIHLDVIIELDGEIYECWVLNTPKFAPSVYSNFKFNSYCSFEGKAFGANGAGIYELAGDTDAGDPIDAGVTFSKTTFGVPTAKRLLKAHIGYTGGTPVIIIEVENGTRKTYTIDKYNTVIGNRDVKGRQWKLSVAGFDALDTIKLIPLVLSQ